MENTAKWQTFKGRPFVKNGTDIYYGFPYEKFVTLMQITATETVDGEEIPTKVMVNLIATDKSLSPIEAIKNKGEKDSLADAFEMADIWLTVNNKA